MTSAAHRPTPFRILIVDDHPLLRQGLTQLIQHEKNLNVCAEAPNATKALEVVAQTNPDIAIVDLTLENSSGLDLIKDLKIQFPQVKVLVVSMHDESLYAERALRAGAMGYLMKREASDVIVQAIYRILDGHIFLSDRMNSLLLHKLISGRSMSSQSPMEDLSDRELQVLQLIARGCSTRQIADDLHLSTKTIEYYRHSLRQKLNLQTNAELVHQAVLWDQHNQKEASAK